MKSRMMGMLLTAAGLGCLFALPVKAQTVPFTTQDGVISIELPDQTWKEADDQQTWVTLTNGSDVITMFHLSNGETLPDVAIADDSYTDVCQTWLSSRDEVFVITGSVRNPADFDEVREAVSSVKIEKKGTKKAVDGKKTESMADGTTVDTSSGTAANTTEESETASASDTSSKITDIDVTYYVNSSVLNVRAGNSTSATALGHLSYGDAVKVTGYADNHWYRISYNGATGYVYADYLTDTKPGSAPTTEETSNPAPDFSNVSAIELYYKNGNTVHITKGPDGVWTDDSGLTYNCVSEDGTVWNNSEGSRLTMYDPWATGEIKH